MLLILVVAAVVVSAAIVLRCARVAVAVVLHGKVALSSR